MALLFYINGKIAFYICFKVLVVNGIVVLY